MPDIDINTLFGTNQVSTNGTIVVTNGVANTTGNCLPCNDQASCEIRPSRVASVNNANFMTRGDERIRLRVVNPGTAANLTFYPDGDSTIDSAFAKELIYPELYDLLFNQLGGAHAGIGGTVNGTAGNIWMSGLNGTLRGGFVISRILVRGDSAVVDAVTIDICQKPIDPANSTICYTQLSPFCDFCTTTNSGDLTTHAYTGNFPGSWWNYVNIVIPAGATLTIEICLGAVNVPNTQISTVADAGGL